MAPQVGSTRLYRLYAIYNDGMCGTTGKHQIRFEMDDGNAVLFTLDMTCGGYGANRDGYSDWQSAPWPTPIGIHGRIKIRTSNSWGRLYYLELQTWDVF